jgi:hypothetical protein
MNKARFSYATVALKQRIYCTNIVSIFYWETSTEIGKPSRLCQTLVETHSQVFDLRRPWHFLAVKYNSSACKSVWRPASIEINCMCFRSVHFYLPMFEVIHQWIELRLEPIADIHRFWVGHKYGSFICECQAHIHQPWGHQKWINYIRLEIKRHPEVRHMEFYRQTTWTYRHWPGKYVH